MIVSEREARDMIEEIEQRGEGLTKWETDFIDLMTRTDRNLKYGELDKINQIYEQRVR